MRVKAKVDGFYGCRRRKGAEFDIASKDDLGRWMEVLKGDFDPERKALIIEMLNEADHTNDAQWTKQGKISMKYIEELLSDAAREEVEASLPGFIRNQ